VIVVLDASVILKWMLEDPDREPDTGKALVLVESVAGGTLQVLQPVHWLAEVAAVAARVVPDTAVRDVGMLAALELPTTDSPNVIQRATALAIDTRKHLFDTLYHAVALEHEETLLVTADYRYYETTQHYGAIRALRDWEPGS